MSSGSGAIGRGSAGGAGKIDKATGRVQLEKVFYKYKPLSIISIDWQVMISVNKLFL